MANNLPNAFMEFSEVLGSHLEKVEKGIPAQVGPVRESYGKLLDAADAAGIWNGDK